MKTYKCFDEEGNITDEQVYEWKQSVFEKCKGKCVVCDKDTNIDIYEIDPTGDKQKLTVTNGVVLCDSCWAKWQYIHKGGWRNLERLLKMHNKTMRVPIYTRK